jgi:glutathione S-transferase
MAARLYSLDLSHPGHAVRLMLEHKGIDHRVTMLPPGTHPAVVRLIGFRRNTVPALKLDGRRLQHSLQISRELERIKPDPPLFPSDPELRLRVEAAERWGEAELQPVPRRIIRWALTEQPEAREWLARLGNLPLPALQARTSLPVTRRFAKAVGATAEKVRQDLTELPGKLDEVDALLAEGVLPTDAPNAATFQIGTSVRALTLFPQVAELIEPRPCGRLARTLLPDFPTAPVRLPQDWLPR